MCLCLVVAVHEQLVRALVERNHRVGVLVEVVHLDGGARVGTRHDAVQLGRGFLLLGKTQRAVNIRC